VKDSALRLDAEMRKKVKDGLLLIVVTFYSYINCQRLQPSLVVKRPRSWTEIGMQ
jgi:hypothetical protein